MKQIVLVLGFAGTMLVGILLFFHLSSQRNFSERSGDETEVNGLPVYPGAKLTSHFGISAQAGAVEYVFATNSSRDLVEAFYKDALAKRGWKLTHEGAVQTKSWDSHGMGFVWRSQGKSVPTRKYLAAAFWLMPEGGTNVSLSLEAWPDPMEVPMYADAQNVQTETAQGSLDHTVRYITGAQPEEIQAYYSDMLPKYGWWLVPDSGPDIRSNYGRADGSEGSSVVVHISRVSSGQTQVTLSVLVGGGNP